MYLSISYHFSFLNMLHKITIDVHLRTTFHINKTKQKKKKKIKQSPLHFYDKFPDGRHPTNILQEGKTPERHQGRSLAPWLKHTGPRSVLSGARIMKQPGRSSTSVGEGEKVIDLTA